MPCSLEAESSEDYAECNYIDRPRFSHADLGPTFRSHVTWLPALIQPRRQLWFVAGGPGISTSAAFGQLALQISLRLPDTEAFAVDLRGTGRSEALTCPRYEAEGVLRARTSQSMKSRRVSGTCAESTAAIFQRSR